MISLFPAVLFTISLIHNEFHQLWLGSRHVLLLFFFLSSKGRRAVSSTSLQYEVHDRTCNV